MDRQPNSNTSRRPALLTPRIRAAGPTSGRGGQIGTTFRPRSGVAARTLGSFVPKLTKKVFEKYGFSAAALLTDWAQIVGADLARYTQPERLKWPRSVEAFQDTPQAAVGRPGATLVLRVEGARALDVQYRQRQIIERINAYFGYAAVAEMRIIQAPLTTTPPAPRPRETRPVVPVTAAPTAAPAPGLDQIPDEGLRNALLKLQNGVRAWGPASGR